MTKVSTQGTSIALIGCGAIAEAFHLPALARHPDVLRDLVLVDPNRERRETLARQFGVSHSVDDVEEVVDTVQGAIVATPHHLHEALSLKCIRAGLHVLSEKPLAETLEAAQGLHRASEEAGVSLLVNQTRRLFQSSTMVKKLIDEGAIGRVKRISYTMGEPFEWPAVSASYFGVKANGKGVLFDTGAHIVDLVCWWLGNVVELVSYWDDSKGGTEAVAQVEMKSQEATASIRLSWLSKLANTYHVEGETGSLSGEAYDWSTITLTREGRPPETRRVAPSGTSFDHFSAVLIDNFIGVLKGDEPPRVPASEVLPSIAIIDACYRQRRCFDMPWYETRGVAVNG